MPRACGGREIAGPALKKLIGEYRERNGFLGIGIDAVRLTRIDGQVRQQRPEPLHKLLVVNPAARNDDFSNTIFLGNGLFDRLGDGAGSEFGGGGDQIVDREAGGDQAAREFSAELFAAGGLGRRECEVGIAEHRFEHARMDFTSRAIWPLRS